MTFLVFLLLLNILFSLLTGNFRSLYHFGSLPERVSALYYYTGYSLFDSGLFAVQTSASEISSYIYDTYATSDTLENSLWTVSAPLLLNTIISQVSNYDEGYVSLSGGMGVASISPEVYVAYRGGSSSPFDYRENVYVAHAYLESAFQRFGRGLEIPLGLLLLGKSIDDFSPDSITPDGIRAMLANAGLEQDFDQILYSIEHNMASLPQL